MTASRPDLGPCVRLLGYYLYDLRGQEQRPPLRERGWVLQEFAISPRVVNFTHNEVLWECNQISTDERNSPKKQPENYVVGNFYEVVEAYSFLSLTKSEDKLPAIAALAQIACQRQGSDYLAGCLTKDLYSYLLWGRLSQPLRRLVDLYRAPTWSWASCDGALTFYKLNMQFCTIDDIQLELLDPAQPFGQVKHASITITSVALQLRQPAPTISHISTDEICLPLPNILSRDWCMLLRSDQLSSQSPMIWVTIDDSRLDQELEETAFVIIACSAYNLYGLILTPARKPELTQWSRIGLLHLDLGYNGDAVVRKETLKNVEAARMSTFTII